MIDKQLLKERFSKNIGTYEDNAVIQKQMVNKLLSFLKTNHYNNVLELGCGTGLLTKNLITNISFDSYVAVDFVEKCELYIKEIDKNINFICDDIEHFIANTNTKYDLIISNATFQWIEDLEKFFCIMISRLSKNGILLFSTFGISNFKELSIFLNNKLNYISVNNLKIILPNSEVEEDILSITFDNPLDVLKHIKYTGVNGISKKKWTKKNVSNFIQQYPRSCMDEVVLTYNPIYVKYVK